MQPQCISVKFCMGGIVEDKFSASQTIISIYLKSKFHSQEGNSFPWCGISIHFEDSDNAKISA
ncbi:uncharacterized protein ACA1_324680 [Acanthamoeba castellanii str. Neff]|uniref:Uncharacterized protein n=1 Tax=Acanthamoeba castellanii (strain ATCC 30010 / Neff) TaxID=1257118 RepID=L8GH54_ACACF|nr:uncharacterized protein ACA1_324680 [Acanthamoeba castellanii str. Neff]ELR12425.1 hypothetical protein ACA1_324680 [Acanthamoeba castellanii str. Neff]